MTTGKREPPLWLDLSFAEALERFAGTSLPETKEAEQATTSKKKVGGSTPPPDKLNARTPRNRRRPRKPPA